VIVEAVVAVVAAAVAGAGAVLMTKATHDPTHDLLINSTVTESPFALLFQTLYFSITFK